MELGDTARQVPPTSVTSGWSLAFTLDGFDQSTVLVNINILTFSSFCLRYGKWTKKDPR